jgi:hypothetical protein
MASFVVVLPALPVTPTTVPPQWRRAQAPRPCNARRVSATSSWRPWASGGISRPASTTTPAAPFAMAAAT